ncbi:MULTISPECIES: rod shape-determining protein RodA [Thiorhodovibrio]|uniref:rod shape-determining protein RodA n=1 Tax=Thiorhodovibrio TaxID=61593 RepID=UPI001912BA7A|nr:MULTISPECIES: rod shape-determining protein RodA [Thiorhodovibrio]MBK5971127.1 rod shape-determining protein RodA [Thiorhodovibrio winogradskyi]WPL10505.1 Rod shape-determining protein RodA [Thiorhodovibrio litoralis]
MATLSDSLSSAQNRGLFERLHIDLPLLLGVLVLCGCGLAILFSATDQSTGQVERQMIRLGLAFGIMTLIAQVHPDELRRWSLPLFGFGVAMLVAVAITGEIGKGAQRWLDLGVVRFQPSELLKLAVPMMLAWFFSGATLPPSLPRILVAVVLTAIPVLLIARQPDLGTALMVTSAAVMVLFMAGLSWRLIGVLAALAAGAAPVLWYLMHDYQRQRVLTFLDPQSDPLGSGYHIIQSQIAIGSGGIYGKGWFHGTQSHLEFLPERSTDFIFAVLGEEFGLVGILVVLLVYLFIIFRGLYIAAHAPTSYARLLAGAITMVFFTYLFVNTGMVVGLLPVVGVPLPLISYGGTSLVTIMAGFGILMSIQTAKYSQSR